uniref:Uncharacterized protein n=1 Tax=Microcebus murinus TaxID=30608 RepID=A0A8C5VCC8_MICMU
MAVQISKRTFVADGIIKAELNEFLTQETEIIILATRTQNVPGEKGQWIRGLTAVVQRRFGFPECSVGACWHQGEDHAALGPYR